MEFKEFNEQLMDHVMGMSQGKSQLFVVDVDKDTLWNTYLDSFPPGTNEVFRKRREHDCSHCRHFIRDFGRVVALNGTEMISVWDFVAGDEKYQVVIDALSRLVKSRPVCGMLVPVEHFFGTRRSRECLDNGDIHTWYHLHAEVSRSVKIHPKDSVGTVYGRARDVRNVFQRSLEEIDKDAVDTVLELIAQRSLYKGEEWDTVLETFRTLQKEYRKILDAGEKNNYCWGKSTEVGHAVAKIRNHSIGVLLTDISEGVELDIAVKRYEKIVAPTNYKRPKAIFTKKMVAKAEKTVVEMGLEGSLGRRYARMSDITVNNTLFANRDARKAMSPSVFDELAESVPAKEKNFNRIEEVAAETFVNDILPTATSVEMLLENEHVRNMVSLVAPTNADSKTMFKWNNNFSWAYAGNITDSMKERVKAAGGNVEGVLRFSIMWNEENDCLDDLDAHCVEPQGGRHIYFSSKGQRHHSSGMLDVDVIQPNGVAVENITWLDPARMPRGTYRFFVHNYTHRGGLSGFKAEVEFDGQIYHFEYPEPLGGRERVDVAEVDFDGKTFTMREVLKAGVSSKEIWGLSSNKFHPVSISMYSPNYWDAQKGVGHRHYFFMLDGCRNPDRPNGFFNEFLKEELMEHKRVFEALGAKMKVEESDEQLSGLGFSATKRASVVVKTKGAFERLIRVVF
jgi:hypothetical protein